MLYLDQPTVKFFLYFIYSKNDPLDLGMFSDESRIALFDYIFTNDLKGVFYCKINKARTKDKFSRMDDPYAFNIEWFHKEADTQDKKYLIDSIFKIDEDATINAYIVASFRNPASLANITRILNLYINIKKKEKLRELFNRYLDDFIQDRLISNRNFYSFEKTNTLVISVLKDHYQKYGNNFVISSKELEARFNELIYFLESKGYLNINSVDFASPTTLNISVTLKMSPYEFEDIEKYWLYYGDIRINEKDGVAFYKKNKYPFKSTSGKSFKLLCHLVRNHGIKIPIEEAYEAIYIDDSDKKEITFGEKKNYIKDYVKEIKERLKILEDKNPTISIMIRDDSLRLISNPPNAPIKDN